MRSAKHNSFHQLSRCSKITIKTNSCLRHPFLPEQKADAGHASRELADKTNHVKTISRSLVCTATNWGPQHRRREEHSLVSLSLGCEIYKRHLSFSLLFPSQTTFSSPKHQNLNYRNHHAMNVPLRRVNKSYTKDVFATLTSTIRSHLLPETNTKIKFWLHYEKRETEKTLDTTLCLRAFETIYKTCTTFPNRSPSYPFVKPFSWSKEENKRISYKHRYRKQTAQKLYICSVISASLYTRLEMNKRHPSHPAIHSSPTFLCAKRAAKCLHESSVRPLPRARTPVYMSRLYTNNTTTPALTVPSKREHIFNIY